MRSRFPRLVRSFMLLVLNLGLAASPAFAAWPSSPYSAVTAGYGGGPQGPPAAASDSSGGVIVTWMDWRVQLPGAGIYAQRFSAAGATMWGTTGLAVCIPYASFSQPVIASDGAGGAIIAWADSRNGNSDIFAQRVSATGTPLWTANGVALCAAAGEQTAPSIVADGQGGAVVAWQDDRNGNWDIYAQVVNSIGATSTFTTGYPVCTAAGDQQSPKAVTMSTPGAIIVWTDHRGADWDIYGQRLVLSPAVTWPSGGAAVCTALGDQMNPVASSNAAFGTVVAWEDYRSGTPAVYAQLMNSSGGQRWGTDGVAVGPSADLQYRPSVVPDGRSGAIFAWENFDGFSNTDIYAQRIDNAGLLQWGPAGVALCTAAGTQSGPMLVSDGEYGAIAMWVDYRTGTSDLYARRIDSTGAPQWNANGNPVCLAGDRQESPVAIWDGMGGVLAVWWDWRRAIAINYATRIERFGHLGNPEPVIATVRDVPNDQGGRVKLAWDASYLDTQPGPVVDHYWILRSVPSAAAAAALAAGARIVTPGGGEPAPRRQALVTQATAEGTIYWEYLTSIRALHIVSGYSYLAPTASDSTAAGNPSTDFMVVALDASDTQYWSSAAASGYSVDNLAPATPSPFTGTYASGATALHWGAGSEADLAGYRLYRGSVPGFVPDPGNLVVAQPDTGFVDHGGRPYFYKLTAVDIHGNESAPALLTPAGTAGIDPPPPGASLWLAPVAPNPAPGEAVVRFGLPESAYVTLALYDPQGRCVRRLVAAHLSPGEHTARWDGRDGAGRPASSGIYLVRLESEGRRLAGRLAIVR